MVLRLSPPWVTGRVTLEGSLKASERLTDSDYGEWQVGGNEQKANLDSQDSNAGERKRSGLNFGSTVRIKPGNEKNVKVKKNKKPCLQWEDSNISIKSVDTKMGDSNINCETKNIGRRPQKEQLKYGR